jgi:hypothetical protein
MDLDGLSEVFWRCVYYVLLAVSHSILFMTLVLERNQRVTMPWNGRFPQHGAGRTKAQRSVSMPLQ